MPDLTAELLPVLQQHRLPGFDLGDEFIYPFYQGRSILNIPSTISQLLGAPALGAGALEEAYLSPLGLAGADGVRSVITVVMDALGLHTLKRWMEDGTAPIWKPLAKQGVLAPLTSITPSTTSAALPSLWTGRSATEHGITGYEMWMKEYGVVANTILHAPITFRGEAGTLAKAGFSAAEYLPSPTLGSHLAADGVRCRAFQHHSIIRSGLSEMFFRDVEPRAFVSSADLWVNLRQYLESQADQRLYTWVYWSEVDTLSHRYGPENERTAAEFSSFSTAMEKLFLNSLSDRARQGTLLILIADHGQIATRPDPHYELRNHPALLRRLHIYPTGENRLVYLFIRPGQTEAVREYLERTWPNQFYIVDSAYALASGLFGPGQSHPQVLDRLGDQMIIARGEAYWWWSEKENFMRGRHGGLSASEMLVPFLAFRL
jgi:hypothetical protein